MNTLTIYQKGSLCGEIRIHVKTDQDQIDEELRDKAARLLAADPQHQRSYYDVLLVDQSGSELDFETHIL